MNKLFSRRRSSKATSRNGSATDTTTNFFSLPAEMRNVIYELAAQDLPLTIAKRGSPASTRDMPGLLLVSRRCRLEVLPILLSNCAVTITVSDFKFSNVLRVVGGLYSRELKALRANEKLLIVLDGSERPTERDLSTNLRPWVKHQAQNIDRLPWRYRLAVCGPECARARQCGHAKLLELLREGTGSSEEILGWEIRVMVESVDETWTARNKSAMLPKRDWLRRASGGIIRSGV